MTSPAGALLKSETEAGSKLFPWKARVWVLLIVLFLVSRIILVLWGYESIYSPEDKEQGYIAIELLSGQRASLLNYQADVYSGGTLIFGVLAVPFIYFLGPAMFSLKIMALLISLLTFGVMAAMMGHLFGSRTAVYAALIWIFSPPVLTNTALLVLGSHEVLAPVMVFFFSFCAYLSAKDTKSRLLFLSFAGISAGLALTFSYIAFISLAAAGGVYLYRRPRRFSIAEMLCFTLCFTAGAFEIIAYNMTHRFSGFNFAFETTLMGVPYKIKNFWICLKGFVRFFLRILPYGLSFRPPPGVSSVALLNYLYFGVIAFVLLIDIARSFKPGVQPGFLKRMPVYFFRIYLVLYPAIYVLSFHQIYISGPDPWNYRYLVHYYAFLILYFSAILARLRYRRFFLAGILAMGFISQVSAVWGKPFGQVFDELAFVSGLRRYIWKHPDTPKFKDIKDFENYISSLKNKITVSQGEALQKIANDNEFWALASSADLVRAVLEIPSERYRGYFFRRWGICLEVYYRDTVQLEKLKAIYRSLPPAYQEDFVYGIVRGSAIESVPDLLFFVRQFEVESSPSVYLAFGNNLFRAIRNDDPSGRRKAALKAISRLKDPVKSWIYRGIGSAIYRSFHFRSIVHKNLDYLEPMISREEREDLYWGIGYYLGRRHFDEPDQGLQKIELFNLPQRVWVAQGFHFFGSRNRHPQFGLISNGPVR